MTTVESGDEHVRLKLGLYVLGGLAPAESSAVEDHLATCAWCHAEATELGEVREFLDVLTTADIDEIATSDRDRMIRESAATSATWATNPASAHRSPLARAMPAPPSPPNRHAAPGNTGPRSTARGKPARPGPGNVGPDRATRHRRPAYRYRLVAAAIALALVVGVGLGVWFNSGTPMEVTLAGSGTNSATGVGMSVKVVGNAAGSHIEAAVTGLEPGVVYQVYAVSAGGDTQVAIRWIGAVPDQTVTGDSPIRTADLAFVTLTRGDGGVLVTVRVARSGGTT